MTEAGFSETWIDDDDLRENIVPFNKVGQ